MTTEKYTIRRQEETQTQESMSLLLIVTVNGEVVGTKDDIEFETKLAAHFYSNARLITLLSDLKQMPISEGSEPNYFQSVSVLDVVSDSDKNDPNVNAGSKPINKNSSFDLILAPTVTVAALLWFAGACAFILQRLNKKQRRHEKAIAAIMSEDVSMSLGSITSSVTMGTNLKTCVF